MQVLSDGVSPIGLTKSKAELRIDLMQAVGAATAEVAKNSHLRTSAWKHLVLEGAAKDAILATADQLHALEDLFGSDELSAEQDNHEVFVAVHDDEDDKAVEEEAA
eukprot:1771939-Amphidinium_carterae.1